MKQLFITLVLLAFCGFGQAQDRNNNREEPTSSERPAEGEEERAGATASNSLPVFGKLTKKLDGSLYRASGFVYVKYREEYNSDTFKFNIYNEANNQIIANQQNLPVTTYNGYGDNRLVFNLSTGGVYIDVGVYVLEVINEKNEKSYLRFKREIIAVSSGGNSTN